MYFVECLNIEFSFVVVLGWVYNLVMIISNLVLKNCRDESF